LAVHKHLPDVLKMPPISQHGKVTKIIDKFGGADQLSVVDLTNYTTTSHVRNRFRHKQQFATRR